MPLVKHTNWTTILPNPPVPFSLTKLPINIPNDIKKIEESLDMLGDVTKGFEVEANIDEVYVDEDDLPKPDETYDDGYEDAMNLIQNERTAITQLYGCLFQKIEHLAYGYGNQDPLTKEDIQTIRELLHYRFKEWQK